MGLDYYEEDSIIPEKGHINISDYALIHNTKDSQIVELEYL